MWNPIFFIKYFFFREGVGIVTIVEQKPDSFGIFEITDGIIEGYFNGFPSQVDLKELRQARTLGLGILSRVVELHGCIGCNNGEGVIDLDKARQAIEQAERNNWILASEQIRELSSKVDGGGEESSALLGLSKSMIDD
jgi:sulfur relay (sulfurtransferase) complex TusBCD TusD component (DsrE family)